MAQMYRILGKRGRITIPYEIRQRVGFSQNDVLSFTESSDGRTVLVKREKRNNKTAMQISQKIAEINATILKLNELRSKGYLAPEVYQSQIRQMQKQLSELKDERQDQFESRILAMLQEVRKLKALLDEIEEPLDEFDEKLFTEIVVEMTINHADELTVTLLGGLKFTELI